MPCLIPMNECATIFSQFQKPVLDSVNVDLLYREATSNPFCYSQLLTLYDLGQRLPGTPSAERAQSYLVEQMKTSGLYDTVYLQAVKVPFWLPGDRPETFILPASGKQFTVLPLGGCHPTKISGLTAEIVEFGSLDELKAADPAIVKGKIVFMNHKFPLHYSDMFEAYDQVYASRSRGAQIASLKGALGFVIRSLTPVVDDYPHTGGTYFEEGAKPIPAFALSTQAANELSLLLKQGKVDARMTADCTPVSETISYNIIGEIRGTDRPDEIMIVSGHWDTWFVGGAHDDGAGVVQSLAIPHYFQKVGYRPIHTLRVVLFANEEYYGRGSQEYAKQAKFKNEKHVLAMESDEGGFAPRGFRVLAPIKLPVCDYLNKKLSLHDLALTDKGEPANDIADLKEQCPLLLTFRPDSQRYFEYHHSEKDTPDKVNPRELELGAVAMASAIFLFDQYEP